ncbi:hypothetical protein Lal_00012489 [Lupinus albus]|nr:hypothetical protein Lal_00012489 [Lupinus albus]
MGNNSSDFDSLIRVRDKIEQNMKTWKINAKQNGEYKKPNHMKKKEVEAHYVAEEPYKTTNKTNYNPQSYTSRP